MDGKKNGNFCKPEGTEGLATLGEMNEHHRELSLWGLSKLDTADPKSILDIGCGGGMFISLLGERFPKARIDGIDHSPEAVEYASELNKGLIESGRCHIGKANVSDLPFDGCSIDLVTAVETYFFWPDPEKDISEACRVVSPGGNIMILAESYPHPDFEEQNSRYRELYGVNLIENKVMEKLLESNGFSVEVHTVEGNNWVVFVGTKLH